MQRLAADRRIGLWRFLHRKILQEEAHDVSNDPREILPQRRDKADLLALKIACSMTFMGFTKGFSERS